MKKIISPIIIFVLVFCFWINTKMILPASMQKPFTVVDTVAYTDGGSIVLKLTDAKGNYWAVKRSVDLKNQKEILFFTNYFLGPISWDKPIEKGSTLEAQVIAALKYIVASDSSLKEEEINDMIDANKDVKDILDAKIITAYQLLYVLKKRK